MIYLFLLLGNDSFYESIIMSKFVDEMPEDTGIICITGQLQTAYFSDNPKIIKVHADSDIAENKQLFEELTSENQVSGIFVFDFHKAFFKSTRPIIHFDIKWLENLNIPVNLIDMLDLFSYNDMDQLYLTNSSKYNKKNQPQQKEEDKTAEIKAEIPQEKTEGGDHLDIKDIPDEEVTEDITITGPFWPNIIKLSPPYPTPAESPSKKIFFWHSPAKNYLTDDIERMKAPLNISDDKKNVFLIFSYQMLLQSLMENKQGHYRRIINTLIHYLKELDIEMNLFVAGFDVSPELTKGTKINTKSFKKLNHGLYKTLTTYASLIITDTPWHPVLLDAAELKIPAGVIGNSLNLLEDGTMESTFETTDIVVFHELETAIQESPNIFYPYIAFPLKNDSPPEFTFYDEKFMYYLLDIYCDSVVIPFLGEFLITDAQVTKKLNEVQEMYMDRADGALTTEVLLAKLESTI